MKISEQIQSLKKTDMRFNITQRNTLEECEQFVQKMKEMGAFRPQQQTPARIQESGLDQLKHLSWI